MGILKPVLVKTTIYSEITDPVELRQYGLDCVTTGSTYILFKDPAITTAFYASITLACGAIQTAINTHTTSPTEGNKAAIGVAMDALILILDSYALQVETISNLAVNAATREAAYANILLSFLTPQKLNANSKGDPQILELRVTDLGGGKAEVEIMNGADFDPSSIVVFAVSQPATTLPPTAAPIVTLSSGQITMLSAIAVQMISMSVQGKGRKMIFTGFTKGVNYMFYGYSQNGKKQISLLCAGVPMPM
jgi:hypothetical protein